MEKRCEICETKDNCYNTVTTTDMKLLCVQCYKRVARELGKGLFTAQEAIECQSFINRHVELIDQLLLICRKKARNSPLSAKQQIRVLEAFEDSLSIRTQKKARNTLSVKEHCLLLEQVALDPQFQDIPGVVLGPNNGQEGIALKGEYLSKLYSY